MAVSEIWKFKKGPSRSSITLFARCRRRRGGRRGLGRLLDELLDGTTLVLRSELYRLLPRQVGFSLLAGLGGERGQLEITLRGRLGRGDDFGGLGPFLGLVEGRRPVHVEHESGECRVRLLRIEIEVELPCVVGLG